MTHEALPDNLSYISEAARFYDTLGTLSSDVNNVLTNPKNAKFLFPVSSLWGEDASNEANPLGVGIYVKIPDAHFGGGIIELDGLYDTDGDIIKLRVRTGDEKGFDEQFYIDPYERTVEHQYKDYKTVNGLRSGMATLKTEQLDPNNTHNQGKLTMLAMFCKDPVVIART